MDAIRGFVYRTIYENTQRTYCVFVLKDYNEEYITCTGKFESPKEGEDIEVRGCYVEHEKYGRQFDATSVEKLKPDNMGAAKTYLLNLGIPYVQYIGISGVNSPILVFIICVITGIGLYLIGRGCWKLLVYYIKGMSKVKNNLSI